MSAFTVFPAIDLRRGQVVRLKEGDPNQVTHYGTDPLETARKWLEAGAAWLHIVNLDGAFGEESTLSLQALQRITELAKSYSVPVQFGGGMRSQEAIERVLEMGVTRAILGSAVIEEPQVLDNALKRWGEEHMAVSLDARDGIILTRGWQTSSQIQAADFATDLRIRGLSWLVYTDVSRDGLQIGINLDATCKIAQVSGLNVIASGGVSGWEDIRQAADAGLAGIIVGRALYENKFTSAHKLFTFRQGKTEPMEK
jgi:phosphoribosylformimino-5-aminoimidazole carboxamide ribotide isomerase